MRDYVRRKGKYKIDGPQYMTTLWAIRDYQRCKDVMSDDVVLHAISYDGDRAPTNGISDPTYDAAIKVDSYEGRVVFAVESSLCLIPREYRRGIWMSIQHHAPYPIDAASSTYAYWKSKFVYDVGCRLGIITTK